MCLERSRDSDLSIDINLWYPRMKTSNDLVFEILDMFLSHVPRIAYLLVGSSPAGLSHFLCKKPAFDPARLQTWIWRTVIPWNLHTFSPLDVQGPHNIDWDFTLPHNPSPSILNRIGFAWVAPPIKSYIWDDKKEIYLDQLPSQNFDEYIDIMTRSPQLQVFSVRGTITNGPYSSRTPIRLDSLCRLSLFHVPYPGLAHLFKAILCPNLMHLSITPCLPEIPGQTMYTLLTSPSDPLSLLKKITVIKEEATGLVRASDMLSGHSKDGLATISINLLYRDFFPSFAIRDRIYYLFPNLEELEMDYFHVPFDSSYYFTHPLTCVSLQKLIILYPSFYALRLAEIVISLPNLSNLTIQYAKIQADDFAIIDKLLGSRGCRVLVFRDVELEGLDGELVHELTRKYGLESVVWEESS